MHPSLEKIARRFFWIVSLRFWQRRTIHLLNTERLLGFVADQAKKLKSDIHGSEDAVSAGLQRDGATTWLKLANLGVSLCPTVDVFHFNDDKISPFPRPECTISSSFGRPLYDVANIATATLLIYVWAKPKLNWEFSKRLAWQDCRH